MPLIAESDLWKQTVAALNVEGAALHDVLGARQSMRDFAADPIPLEQLESILHTAASADTALWSRSGAPQVWVATGAQLSLFSEGRPIQSIPAAALAPLLANRYAAAPALLLICGNLNGATAAQGGAGYRQALLRASGFGYAAWLSALTFGLGGCLFGRSSAEVTSLVREHTATRHLFTVALGTPAAHGERMS